MSFWEASKNKRLQALLAMRTCPFETWKNALNLDIKGALEESADRFGEAAQEFFECASKNETVARAFFEYSTVMDAFRNVQVARLLKEKSDYDGSLSRFTKASEILRSTVHYAFLASYASGCATFDTALELDDLTEGIEALKSAIALFEQSKLALGFRDERHPIIVIIDSMINRAVSKAMFFESSQRSPDAGGDGQEKLDVAPRSSNLQDSNKEKMKPIDYFPLDDWKRAQTSCFIVTYPGPNSMLLVNVGCNPVELESLGGIKVAAVIEPKNCFTIELSNEVKGKIRVSYQDLREKAHYDEGCMLRV